MAHKVEDYIDVARRAKELQCSLPTGLAIIPLEFETGASAQDLRDASHTTTVKKFFKEGGVSFETFLPDTEHLPYVIDKHFEWLGPTLFIPLALLNDNPQIVSLAIGVLSNCISDFLKGIPKRNRNVKLKVIVETTKGCKYKKLSYDVDIDGLAALPKIISGMIDER
jgi:hypothetical protein